MRRSATLLIIPFLVLFAVACNGKAAGIDPTPTPHSQTVVLEGVFETGFEHSGFYAGVSCPDGSSAYWLSWLPESKLAERITEKTGVAPFAEPHVRMFRIKVRAELSEPGNYGHLGAYSREMMVHEVISAELAECDSSAASELRLAKERWAISGPSDYQLRFERHCECLKSWAGPVDVTVEGGLVIAAMFEDTPAPDGAATTVEGLFAAIDEALADGVETEVTYDPDDGHPVSVRLDLDAIAVDGGLALEVLELEYM